MSSNVKIEPETFKKTKHIANFIHAPDACEVPFCDLQWKLLRFPSQSPSNASTGTTAWPSSPLWQSDANHQKSAGARHWGQKLDHLSEARGYRISENQITSPGWETLNASNRTPKSKSTKYKKNMELNPRHSGPWPLRNSPWKTQRVLLLPRAAAYQRCCQSRGQSSRRVPKLVGHSSCHSSRSYREMDCIANTFYELQPKYFDVKYINQHPTFPQRNRFPKPQGKRLAWKHLLAKHRCQWWSHTTHQHVEPLPGS